MSSRTDITPLSITNGKISNQAKIDPRKLAPAKEGQVLIAGKDGKFLAGNLPTTTVTNTVTTEEEVLPPNQIKIGPNTAEPGATNQFVNVGAGEHSIPRRDSSGNLKAETADQATNADQATTATNADNATNSTKLNNQEASFYTDVANHNYGTPTTTTDGGNNKTTTKRVHEVVEYVPATSYGSSNYPISFEHLMPYIPDVSVYLLDNNEYYEVDAEVKATAASGNTAGTIKVDVSESNLNLKIIAS
tara:strand:+ start:523 stop:1263 length:741 start_codon:yes stop_codon:yes gene_type:complete